MALSDARKKANKKWDDANKDRVKYIRKRSQARTFIRDDATIDDIEELENLLRERKESLKKGIYD